MLDEWDETLRYLRLLMAVQAEGAPSWEHVQRCVEQLRDWQANGAAGRSSSSTSQGASSAAAIGTASASASTGDVQAVRQLQEQRRTALREAEARDGELSEELQQARVLQRQGEQLRFRLSLEREARSTERHRMAEHGENLAGELRRGEAKLREVEAEVEELQKRILESENLKVWQVERVESLRQEIAQARERTSQHTAKSEEHRARLDAVHAAQEERLRLREAAAAAREAVAASAPLNGTLPSETSSWEESRRSIERIRDQVHMAIHQARVTVAAS